jgi:signal transduction histidine kinase
MVRSTQDLDQVVKDLTLILGIRKLNTQVMQKILLTDLLQKVLTTLEEEIKETDAQVFIDLKAADTVMSLYPYVESIFFNLVSNAIKYRHPERVSTITIQSAVEAGFVKIDVADNGLGIDLEKNQDNLFSIYKRFHFHVEGKGLGLFLVKTQVAAVGGKVEVRSDGRSGTVFSIYLLQV